MMVDFNLQFDMVGGELVGMVVEKLLLIVLTIAVSSIIIQVVNKLLSRLFGWTEFDPTLEKFMQKTSITILWLVAFGIILIILGVDLNAIVASFGVASFVVGFALKDTLNNFAAGVMILMNHPFGLGDDVEIKKVRGIVKTVSMSNTKLKTEDGNKITIPNSIVWGNPIINYSAYATSKGFTDEKELV